MVSPQRRILLAFLAALASVLVMGAVTIRVMGATRLVEWVVAALAIVMVAGAGTLAWRELKAHRLAEGRFRTVVESVPGGVLMVSQDGTIVLVNRETERLFGYSRDDLLGQSIERLVPERFRSRHPGDRGSFLAHSQTRPMGAGRDLYGLRSDGTEIPMEIGLNPIETAAGRFVLASVVDITERKRAEARFQASERRARTLFDTVHLVVLGLNREARVDYLNPYFLELTGYSAAEALGTSWVEQFVPVSHRPEMSTVLRELIDQGTHPYYENPIVTKAGVERLIAWNNTVLRDEQGLPTGTLSIGEDITEHRRLEEQFRHAQKMEAVGRLAGGVAHDFNNLLTAILGHSELLLDELPPEGQQHEDVVEIRTAAERAAGLTRQLLAFSRQQVLELAVLNVNDVVGNLEKMLRRLLGEDVTLRSGLASDLGNVRADAGQLEQVLANLAVNARDAMPAGGVLAIETANAELTEEYLDAHRQVTAGSYVLITVSDTGTGMSVETKARLFEPFYTTKEQGKGTGLGLSTVYGIVKQLGGYVWVYSEPGRGTTFKIYLPRVHAPADSPVPVPKAQGIPTGTETVVLAEDDDQLRKLVSGYLSRLGYRVLAGANADEAVAEVRGSGGAIHLLLTDMVMPGRSGRQLADQLATMWPELRVLFMSGHTDRGIVEAGLVVPGRHYLQKPFTPAVLARRVREVLDA